MLRASAGTSTHTRHVGTRPCGPQCRSRAVATKRWWMTALEGLKVVEMAGYVAGPYAGALLADLGADVVKVEVPPRGDPYRGWASGNDSSMFCSLNRNKQSVMLDLKSPRGARVARALVVGADVLIENSRPGAMERLGLGYDQVKGENPALVYCSITGFGLSGPDHQRPGYDTVGQATSGLLTCSPILTSPSRWGSPCLIIWRGCSRPTASWPRARRERGRARGSEWTRRCCNRRRRSWRRTWPVT
ncbi:MAG: hypothetical protein GEU81_10965 [Nitriliruptorales bacterium]|nr:hypothetical protein [Nitriliruptorales bacterium]